MTLILFDGVCNLCNGSVQFILRRDPGGRFQFAALQSDYGQQQLKRVNMRSDALYSIVLIDGNQHFERSTAALRIARHLSGGWPLLYVLMVIPSPVRDFIYDWIARNRYRWFGRRESCMLPDPAWKSRFPGDNLS